MSSEFISWERFRALLRGAQPENDVEVGMLVFLRLNEIEIFIEPEEPTLPLPRPAKTVGKRTPPEFKQGKGA